MCLGLPGRITEIVDAERHIVLVDVDGAVRRVSTAMLAEGGETVAVGEWVDFHQGLAFSKIDETEALATIELMRDLVNGNLELDADDDVDARLDADAG